MGDAGFLTSVSVSSYEGDDIKVFPSDRVMKFVTEYNASEVHTGVMGMEFIFISSEESVMPEDLSYSVDACVAQKCDPTLLPPVSGEMLMKAEGKQEDVCVDTIADSMGCKFGNLCSCDEFVRAPESTGCNGVYTSDWGDIEINSLCREYCGCPPLEDNEGGDGNADCDDEIEGHPACMFGGLCDCEILVSAPESTGCGGVYKSEMGDIVIDELCPSFCNACPDTSLAEKLSSMYVEILEADLSDSCQYSTIACSRKLSNVATCAREKLGFEALDPIVQTAVMVHGDRVVRKHSKLGNPSLHYTSRQEEEIEDDFQLCSETVAVVVGGNGETPYLKGSASGAIDVSVPSTVEEADAGASRGTLVLSVLFGVAALVLVVVVVKARL